MIRGVLFDVTGVLSLPDPGWIAGQLSAAGVAVADPGALDLAYYRATAAYDTQKRQLSPGLRASTGPRADLSFGAAYALGAGLPASQAPQVEQVLLRQSVPVERRRPVSGAAQSLRRLSAAGLRLGVVANSADGKTAAWLTWWARQSGVPVAGLAVVDSAVAGLRKPDPRIFAAALTALGLPAADVLHVGDSVHLDVLGARAVGLPSLHFDPFEICEHDDHPHAGSHADVVAWVLAHDRPGPSALGLRLT